jgi:hypothetical protein
MPDASLDPYAWLAGFLSPTRWSTHRLSWA